MRVRSKASLALITILVSLGLVATMAPSASAEVVTDKPQLTTAQQVEARQVQAILDHAVSDAGFDRAAALAVAPASVVDDFETGYVQGPTLAKKCHGARQMKQFWWGWRAKINSCDVDHISDDLTTFGVVAGFLAAIFPGDARSKSIMGITAAIVAAGGNALARCGKRDRGVRIYKTHTYVSVIGAWCKSQ